MQCWSQCSRRGLQSWTLLRLFILTANILLAHANYTSFDLYNIFGTKYLRMNQVKLVLGNPFKILLGPFLNTLSHLISHLNIISFFLIVMKENCYLRSQNVLISILFHQYNWKQNWIILTKFQKQSSRNVF